MMSKIHHETTSWVFGVTSSHNITSLHCNQGCVQPDVACQEVHMHAKNVTNIPKIPHMSTPFPVHLGAPLLPEPTTALLVKTIFDYMIIHVHSITHVCWKTHACL